MGFQKLESVQGPRLIRAAALEAKDEGTENLNENHRTVNANNGLTFNKVYVKV